jgi:hypothetical protein
MPRLFSYIMGVLLENVYLSAAYGYGIFYEKLLQ